MKTKEIAMTRIILIVCALLLANAFPAAADDGPCKGISNEGRWMAGKPVKIPMVPFCTIRYACGPSQSTIVDASCKLDADIETVKGACSAGTGAVDECNSCLAGPPSRTCHYKWVKR
jgi:hypothetical protein